MITLQHSALAMLCDEGDSRIDFHFADEHREAAVDLLDRHTNVVVPLLKSRLIVRASSSSSLILPAFHSTRSRVTSCRCSHN